LTPLLSPYRLAANSQFALALRQQTQGADNRNGVEDPFHYLRFESGQYGRTRLRELADLQNRPHADLIRQAARAALAQQGRWQRAPPADVDKLLAALPVYPAGRAVDPELLARLAKDLREPQNGVAHAQLSTRSAAGVYIDLDGDNVDEFVLLTAYSGLAYQKHDGAWQLIGSMLPPRGAAFASYMWQPLLEALAKGDFTAAVPRWKQLSVGGQMFQLDGPERPPGH
jgi:hypothetical protein